MVDLLDATPQQAPTLTVLEESTFNLATARRASVEWLMVQSDEPDAEAVLSELLRRPEWHARGACRGLGVEQWFPARGRSTGPGKAICAGCEVRVECLAAGLEDVESNGIWGGSSPAERRQMRRGVA